MFHSILAAVDGSVATDSALTHAIDLAQAEHARLTLLTAETELPLLSTCTMDGVVTAESIAARRAATQENLRRARELVPDDPASAISVLRHSPIPVLIVHADPSPEIRAIRPRQPARPSDPSQSGDRALLQRAGTDSD
jgi:nucleotide-binding universal stress UspA family protein